MVAPKADPGVIALSFSGMEKFYKDASGDLVAELNGKSVRFGKPYAYQKVAGVSKPVEADYELAADWKVHLHVGDYDKSSELIIDPVVSYVTYLGGAEGDTGNGIAVDTTGAAPGVFVTGQTCSSNFPANPNPSGYTLLGNCDAYVTKYSLDRHRIPLHHDLGRINPFQRQCLRKRNCGGRLRSGLRRRHHQYRGFAREPRPFRAPIATKAVIATPSS